MGRRRFFVRSGALGHADTVRKRPITLSMNSVQLDRSGSPGHGFGRRLRGLSLRETGAGIVAIGVAAILLCSGVAQALNDGIGGIERQTRENRAGLSLVDFELPFHFFARMGGDYTRYRYAIDGMAYDRRLSPGPAVRRDSLVESRVSVGHRIAGGVEFEVAWATQSEFSFSSAPGVPRQTVGAYIRFTH